MTTSPIIIIVEPFGGSTRRHSPELPHVYWDDAAVTRGDGVFETVLVRNGRACNVARHLKRFAASAKMLGLPETPEQLWLKATEEAIAEFPKNRDGRMVWTLSRGRETTGNPTAWIVLREVSEKVLAQRETGVKVMTTTRGYSINKPGKGIKTAPWLAVGAKTLGYAAAMAAQRYAHSKGFDDVIYVDGERVLEGATSTVVTVRGKKLRTPTPGGDILPGTTQAALFEYAEQQGWSVKHKDMDLEYLRNADSVWLLSSVRTAVRVTHLDGEKLPAKRPEEEAKVRELLQAALAAS